MRISTKLVMIDYSSLNWCTHIELPWGHSVQEHLLTVWPTLSLTHKTAVSSDFIADVLFTTRHIYRCHTVYVYAPQHLFQTISYVSHPGWSKNVESPIKSYQTVTRSTRLQGGNLYYIHEGITLDEHYHSASRDGPARIFTNYDGTSSSQPYPHQAHILPPRRLVNRQSKNATNDPVSVKSHPNPGFANSNPDSSQISTI